MDDRPIVECLEPRLLLASGGELLFYEPFDYADGTRIQNTAAWNPAGADEEYELAATNGSLVLPAGVNLRTPTGGRGEANITGQPGGGFTSMTRLRHDLGQTTIDGKLYISMLVYHENEGAPGDPTGYSGMAISGFDNVPANRSLWLGKASAGNTRHYLEVIHNGGNVGSGADRSNYEGWTPGVRFMVYVFDTGDTPGDPTDDTLSMYIDPDCSGPEPPAPDNTVALDTAWWWQDAVTQYGGSAGIRYLFFESGTSIDSDVATAVGRVAFDEVRVGTSWEVVTPLDDPPPPAEPEDDPSDEAFPSEIDETDPDTGGDEIAGDDSSSANPAPPEPDPPPAPADDPEDEPAAPANDPPREETAEPRDDDPQEGDPGDGGQQNGGGSGSGVTDGGGTLAEGDSLLASLLEGDPRDGRDRDDRREARGADGRVARPGDPTELPEGRARSFSAPDAVDVSSQALSRFAEVRSATVARALHYRRIANHPAVTERLDSLREEMQKTMRRQSQHSRMMVGAATGMALTAFTGYVIWVMRGGSLLASLLSSVPIWKGFDPLPVLSSWDKRRGLSGTGGEGDGDAEGIFDSQGGDRS